MKESLHFYEHNSQFIPATICRRLIQNVNIIIYNTAPCNIPFSSLWNMINAKNIAKSSVLKHHVYLRLSVDNRLGFISRGYVFMYHEVSIWDDIKLELYVVLVNSVRGSYTALFTANCGVQYPSKCMASGVFSLGCYCLTLDSPYRENVHPPTHTHYILVSFKHLTMSLTNLIF